MPSSTPSSLPHTHTPTRTHAHTHTPTNPQTHTRTHAHTHTLTLQENRRKQRRDGFLNTLLQHGEDFKVFHRAGRAWNKTALHRAGPGAGQAPPLRGASVLSVAGPSPAARSSHLEGRPYSLLPPREISPRDIASRYRLEISPQGRDRSSPTRCLRRRDAPRRAQAGKVRAAGLRPEGPPRARAALTPDP